MSDELNRIEDSTYFKYLALALMPILALYFVMPLFSLGYILMVLLIIFQLLTTSIYTRFNLPLLVTMLTFILINLVNGVIIYNNVTITLNNSAGMVVFTLIAIFVCVPSYLDREKLYTACKWVGIAATLFLFGQFIAYYFLDLVIHGNMPILAYSDVGFISVEYGRPTSFFYEPAHYAIYMAPLYAVALIRKEYRIAFLFLLGLIFSTSSTGVVIALLIPAMVLFKKEQSGIRNFLIIILGFMLLMLITNYFSVVILEKMTLAYISEDVRILGTIDYFQYLNGPEWFFGIGLNKLDEFLMAKAQISTINYANAYLFSVLSFGITGALVWLAYNVFLYKNLDADYRVLFYILVMISITDQILFNWNLLYILMWINCFSARTLTERSVPGIKDSLLLPRISYQ